MFKKKYLQTPVLMKSMTCFVFIRFRILNLDMQAAFRAHIPSPTKYNIIIYLGEQVTWDFIPRLVFPLLYITTSNDCMYFFRTISLWVWVLNISLTSIYSSGRAQKPRDLSHTLNTTAEIIISYVVAHSVSKFHKIQNDYTVLI